MVPGYKVTSKMAWAGVIAIVVATFLLIFFHTNKINIWVASIVGILGVFSLALAISFQNKEDELNRAKRECSSCKCGKCEERKV